MKSVNVAPSTCHERLRRLWSTEVLTGAHATVDAVRLGYPIAAFFMIGTFMAGWIILYGAVQAAAPRMLRADRRPEAELVVAARGWAVILAIVPALLTVAALVGYEVLLHRQRRRRR